MYEKQCAMHILYHVFANSCNLTKFLKQYLNIFVRNFVLCIQIRFVSTEKKYAHRLACILLLLTLLFSLQQNHIRQHLQKIVVHIKLLISLLLTITTCLLLPLLSFKTAVFG